MGQNGLPRLDLLSATPHMLHGLMCELSSEDAQWKPAQDRFSMAEVLAHLSHSEGHCYRRGGNALRNTVVTSADYPWR